MEKKKILINGSSSFIGVQLIKRLLLDFKYEVYALSSSNKPQLFNLKHENLKIINYDLNESQSLKDLLPNKNFDVFIYLAWSGYNFNDKDDPFIQSKNIQFSLKAIKESKDLGVKKFLFASSFSEFMIHENEPSSHADGAVCNIYGASKHATRILSEAYAKKIGINFTSFSLANTFGPGDYSSRSTNHFIKKFLENKPIDLTHGAHLYDWIYIDDSIDAIISILEFGKSFKNYYIGRQAIPLKEILFQVKKILNSDSIINLGKYKEDFHVDYKSVDFFQLTKDTGFVNKTPFDKAIINTATWVKSL